MKATGKHKVLTSGRLTGGGKVQVPRRQVTPNPGPAARPEPAYSLYSTDSEDQVTTLHKGLDRCAALLSGILEADKEASPSLPRAAKSRPSTSLGKKTIKKLPRKTVQKNPLPSQRGPGSTTPRGTHQSTPPAAHSGVKLHPPQKRPPALLQPHLPASPGQTLQRLSPTAPPPEPQASVLLSVLQSSSRPGRTDDSRPASEAPHDGDEEEFVPVRDTDAQSGATADAVGHKLSRLHACAAKMSNMHLEPGEAENIHQDSSAETEKAKTVQCLLGELKALIAGQGSVAERLLSHLEQAVSSPPMNAGSSNTQTDSDPDQSSLRSENMQLRRHVSILNQQLKEKEKAERQQDMETLCLSEVLTLQEELATAQSRLRDLQGDLAELRRALEDTQSQLGSKEAENAALKKGLEATTSRLVAAEREKSELASLSQQRLEEIGNLNRMLQSQDSSGCPTVVNSSVSDTLPPADRITQYLMSLGQLDPEGGSRTAEQQRLTSVHPGDASSHADAGPQRGDEPAGSPRNPHLHRAPRLDDVRPRGLEGERRRLFDSTLSRCDAESVWSETTFNTRDEAAFRDGLAALDASIASLQKTIQLDLRR